MFNKRIIIVTPWFGEFAGGAEALARNTAIEFNKRGIKSIIFTTCCKSPYDSWWEDHYREGVDKVYGVEVHRFATNRAKSKYEKAAGKLAESEELSQEEQNDFFECGINSDNLVKNLKGYIAKDYEIIALPYFQGLTHSAVNSYPGKISVIPCFHNEPQFYWRNIEKLLSNAKKVLFLSKEEKEMTIRQYGLKVGRKIVEYEETGAGIELMPPTDGCTIMRNSLPRRYFVYSGRKERGKNVHTLCEWFTEYVKDTGSSTKLVFIGGGDTSLIPRSKHFVDLGFVSEADKQMIIRNSNGLINLSENESFSFVIMEAWLMGVPVVVSSNCAVTRGHVIRAKGGLFADNQEIFAHVINFLEEREDISNALGSNGREYVKKNFSFDNVLSKYMRVLEADYADTY
jgi:glycosyltransferase involved in cell wall biosynthesis